MGRQKLDRRQFTAPVPVPAVPAVVAHIPAHDVAHVPVEPVPEVVAEAIPLALPHEPSGEVCGVYHDDGQGPCQRCKHCKIKHRPREMTSPCPARNS